MAWYIYISERVSVVITLHYTNKVGNTEYPIYKFIITQNNHILKIDN